MRLPESEIEKVCRWASRVVYLFKVNVPITDMPDNEFMIIRYCWSYGDYLLCPDRWCEFDRARKLKSVTFLGTVICRGE